MSTIIVIAMRMVTFQRNLLLSKSKFFSTTTTASSFNSIISNKKKANTHGALTNVSDKNNVLLLAGKKKQQLVILRTIGSYDNNNNNNNNEKKNQQQSHHYEAENSTTTIWNRYFQSKFQQLKSFSKNHNNTNDHSKQNNNNNHTSVHHHHSTSMTDNALKDVLGPSLPFNLFRSNNNSSNENNNKINQCNYQPIHMFHNKYNIEWDRIVGKGGFGTVYSASYKDNDIHNGNTGKQQFAVKKIHHNPNHSLSNSNSSFQTETNSLIRIHQYYGGHPNIICLHDIYVSSQQYEYDTTTNINNNNIHKNDYSLLIFDMIHGGEMYDDLITNGLYTEQEAIPFIQQLVFSTLHLSITFF